MQSSSSPKKIPIPFADSGDKQVIPNISQIGIVGGRASYPDGFPPLTRTPPSAGGIPPYGTDMNGVLYDISNAAKWSAAGATYKFDSAFSTAIGGYPKGAVLMKSGANGYWQSIIENNTNNPDAVSTGWIDYSSGRMLNVITMTSSGTYTPTPGTNSIVVEVQGGGGGGGGAGATSSNKVSLGGGGGAGGYAKSRITSGFSSVSVIVGAGGAGGNIAPTTGIGGGASSFGSFLSCDGGGGGLGQIQINPGYTATGGRGGASSGGNILNISGGQGTHGISISLSNNIGGNGGSTQFGSGGFGTANNNTPGSSGTGYGAGGGAGVSQDSPLAGRAGGDGANGVVIIWEYS